MKIIVIGAEICGVSTAIWLQRYWYQENVALLTLYFELSSKLQFC